jgi:hypothetical protein
MKKSNALIDRSEQTASATLQNRRLAMSTEILGELFQSFTPTDTKDGKTFGFTVVLREVTNTGECYARAQRAVQTKESFKDYGVFQSSRKFPSLKEAKSWAYKTAKERALRYQ